MNIRSVSITGLFEAFDHHIPLFQREPITIVFGPNGVGKTSILRLIQGALRGNYHHLRHVPFRELSIEFEDGTNLYVTQPSTNSSTGKREPRHVVLSFRLRRDGRVIEGEYQHLGKPHTSRALGRIEQFLPLTRTGPDEWLETHTGISLSFEEVIRQYGPHLPEEFRQLDTPQWLEDLQRSTPVHLIETQRLLAIPKALPRHGPHQPAQEAAVKKCARELADHIKSTLARSANLSQGLERSFPARLIGQEGPLPLSEDEIRKNLSDLDQRRTRLVEAGLLEAGYEPALPAKRFDETEQRVLAVYIRDTEQKLAVFDEVLARIELIKSIVDSRFLGKTLNVDREAGFVVKTRDGRKLDLSGLSSGEQHELVLLYELLFRAERNTLILIDEPELSLHIAWQQKFLRDLLEITKLAQLKALIATHSPQIIHDRWDLTVELMGPSR